MEPKEAVLIFGRIQARYPNWIGSLSETDLEATRGEWVESMLEFQDQPGQWVMTTVIAACKANPGNFPPGVDVLCTFVRKALRDAERNHRQRQEHNLLIDERESRGPRKLSPAAKECFAAVEKMTEHIDVNRSATAEDILGKKTQLNDEEWAEWEKSKT